MRANGQWLGAALGTAYASWQVFVPLLLGASLICSRPETLPQTQKMHCSTAKTGKWGQTALLYFVVPARPTAYEAELGYVFHSLQLAHAARYSEQESRKAGRVHLGEASQGNVMNL
jgi:hypothetical protein